MQASYCNSKRTAVSVPGSGSNGLGSSPGRGHCVVLLVLFWIGYGGVGGGGGKDGLMGHWMMQTLTSQLLCLSGISIVLSTQVVCLSN